MAGTAKKSLQRVARLEKGFPTKDPHTGRVTVFKEPPTVKARKQKQVRVKVLQDSSAVGTKHEYERAAGITRGLKEGK